MVYQLTKTLRNCKSTISSETIIKTSDDEIAYDVRDQLIKENVGNGFKEDVFVINKYIKNKNIRYLKRGDEEIIYRIYIKKEN